MKDIVSYTEEEARLLGRVLFRLGVPSFGPVVGMELLRIVEGIDGVLKNSELTEDQKWVLSGFKQRVTDVCGVAVHHQGMVIEKFSKAITGQK